ncbi:hypothetical protein LguiB_009870 [Lonicera macranthoides]
MAWCRWRWSDGVLAWKCGDVVEQWRGGDGAIACWRWWIGVVLERGLKGASERQRKVKFAATATAKVHYGYKRRNVDPPNASELGIPEEEAVPQLNEGRSECSSTGGSVSPPEDERGQVDKSVPTNEGPGPSVNPSSGGGVPHAEDDGVPVDKLIPTNEGLGPSVNPSSGGGVPYAEDNGGPVDKSVPTNEGPGPSHSRSSGGGVPSTEDDGGPIDKSVITSFESHVTYAIWKRSKAFRR